VRSRAGMSANEHLRGGGHHPTIGNSQGDSPKGLRPHQSYVLNVNYGALSPPRVETQRTRSEFGDKQRASSHGDVLHEHRHLHLHDHRIFHCPEVVNHERNGTRPPKVTLNNYLYL
jgi:hypothetical protein